MPSTGNAEDMDDDFEVHLDESDAAADGNTTPAGGVQGFRYSRVPTAPRPDMRPHVQSPQIYGQPPGALAAGRGAFTGGRGGGMRPWRPQFIPIGATSIEKDESMAFPESAGPRQAIKLPGQTRVTPEEYSEFTTLGQGGVYELDLDRVVDAPWRVPGADMGDFFNYDLTPAKWRGYVKEIQQAFAESRLQEKLHLYEPTAALHDPDMPAELAAALGRKVIAGGTYRPSSTGAQQVWAERLEAPDAILVLASSVEA